MFNLEAAIKKAIADSADAMANQIGQAVRKGLAAEFAGAMLGSSQAPKAAAAPRAGPKTRGSARPNAIKPSELSAVINVIKSKPHLTSVQIQKVAGIDAKQALRVLKKLRKTGAVKVKGRRSVATYTLA